MLTVPPAQLVHRALSGRSTILYYMVVSRMLACAAMFVWHCCSLLSGSSCSGALILDQVLINPLIDATVLSSEQGSMDAASESFELKLQSDAWVAEFSTRHAGFRPSHLLPRF